MSVSVTGKLNKQPNEFQAGESTGFGIRLGQQYYDRNTQTKEWTNYECVIFAKAGPQLDFYRQTLVENAIICISGKEQKIKSFEGQNGVSLSIEILNASLDNVFAPVGQAAPAQQNQQQAPAQSGFQQAPAAAPKPQSFGSFPSQPAQQAPADHWEGAEVIGEPKEKGATLDQVKNHPDIAGDYGKALNLGWVQDSTIPF
jgi:single-strand DNA-binding protein